MADHHRYMASSNAVPPKVPLSPSLAKFRAMVSKDYLSLSPPGVQELTKAFTAAADVDQYMIKKKLEQSDIDKSSRLLLPIKSVEDYILPLMGEELARLCRSDTGVRFEVWDADEERPNYDLVLKKWNNTCYFVLTGNWIKNFVRRKGLKRGDDVGLAFDGTIIFFKLLNKN